MQRPLGAVELASKSLVFMLVVQSRNQPPTDMSPFRSRHAGIVFANEGCPPPLQTTMLR